MAKKQPTVKTPQAAPLSGRLDTLNGEQFQGTYDAWLRQTEAAKPFAKLRELAGRIEAGDRKIGAALRDGKVTPEDDSYKAAIVKLDGLKAERSELARTAQVPHFAFATVHNFLRASRGWGLPVGSRIEIRLPGVFDISVDLAEVEAPF